MINVFGQLYKNQKATQPNFCPSDHKPNLKTTYKYCVAIAAVFTSTLSVALFFIISAGDDDKARHRQRQTASKLVGDKVGQQQSHTPTNLDTFETVYYLLSVKSGLKVRLVLILTDFGAAPLAAVDYMVI